ncbi:BMP family ABC transporter substrate-binding protein [Myxococcota bacterium]|nr:BMP family ABC transporter substrate-binding protein [Myxococcota bacterium]
MIALSAGLLALAACRDAPKEAAPGTEKSEKPAEAPKFRAGIVFDVGGIDDKSFNEAAYRGLMRAKDELGIDVQYYQPSQPADRKTGLRQFAGKDFDIIIGVGFIFSDELLAMAKDFPNLKFACIDMVDKPDAEIPPNLVAIKFREEQGSFLVGALAGLVTKTKKVGFIGGMNVPLIHKFEAGYTAGVKHVLPDAEVVVNYAGETPKAFEDPETGKNRATEQYKSGVDIIFHASGKTGLGVFQAAKEQQKLAIGVDADQWREAPGFVLTSMIKGVDVAVFDVIKSAKDGSFKPGKKILGLPEQGVGLVYDDNNKALIPAEVFAKVTALKEELAQGKIQVPSTK